ncbi:MAG: hypothetical protein AB2809_13690 [Candidatus Thiodiazotropha sp.]
MQNNIPSVELFGEAGIAYISRLLFKETAFMRHIANTLGDDEEALSKLGLEVADNLDYFTGCLKSIQKGEKVIFEGPPHPDHLTIQDFKDN